MPWSCLKDAKIGRAPQGAISSRADAHRLRQQQEAAAAAAESVEPVDPFPESVTNADALVQSAKELVQAVEESSVASKSAKKKAEEERANEEAEKKKAEEERSAAEKAEKREFLQF